MRPASDLHAKIVRVPVGRSAELEQLARLLADDSPAVIVGEAGVGKTTVLRIAAHATGRDVLEGGALSTLDWLDYLALERALGRPMVDGDPTAVAAALEPAVGNAILLLDDLHWAGAATLEVAVALARRVGLLAGVRSGDPGTARVIEQLHSAGFAVIELAGLSRAESGEFVAALRPDLGEAGRARLIERTGGNPLLLQELARTGEASASLRLAIAARLRRLDVTGREAFGVLALAGRPISPEVLGEPGVKSLLDADLAVVGAAGVEVRHTLLAELAVEQMGPDERRELHARIARSVDDEGEAARHFALAGEADRALAAAMCAVQATTRPGEQARHLAVAAASVSGPQADALRLRAARSLEAAHDWDAMIATLALLSDDREAQAAACLLRARGAWTAGDIGALRTAIADGLMLADGTNTDVEVRLRIEQSRIPLFVDSDVDTGVPMARAALELARSTGVDVPRAEYLYGTGLAVADLPGAEEHLRAAVLDAREAGDTSTEFLAANNLISMHESGGDPAVARQLCEQFISRARELALGEWELIMRVALTALEFHAGNYPRVIDESEDLLAQELEPRARDQLLEAFGLALIDVGRIDEAVRRIDSASMARDFRGTMQEQWVRIEAAMWGGRPAEALELTETYLRDAPEHDANTVFGRLTRAWALFDLGRDPGESVAPQARVMLTAIPVEVDGVRALHRGENAAAAGLFVRAAELWAPFHKRAEVRCRWAAGEAARRTGDLVEAVRLLETAEELAKRHGMLPILARVHRSLRAAGVHRAAPRTRTAGGSLTDRQREVLALVGEGLTNGQIAARLGISRHTVVTQLASASAKLGASSRAQAASLATSSPAASSPAASSPAASSPAASSLAPA